MVNYPAVAAESHSNQKEILTSPTIFHHSRLLDAGIGYSFKQDALYGKLSDVQNQLQLTEELLQKQKKIIQ